MKDERFERWAQSNGYKIIRDQSSHNYVGDTFDAYYGWKGAKEEFGIVGNTVVPKQSAADKRLAWVMENRSLRVQGSDERGWCVMDCSDGLTFLVQNAKTYDEAIDDGMKKRPLKRRPDDLPPIPAPLI